MNSRKFKVNFIILFGIAVLGLVLRVWLVNENLHYFQLYGDARNYHIMSHQLVDDDVYGYGLGHKSGTPNAFVTPVYPLFLSSVYFVVHDPYLQITLVRLIQAFIGGMLIPVLAFLTLKRLFRRDDVALLTAFFTAVYPTYVESTFYLLTEVLSLATMLLYFYSMTTALQDRRTGIGILAGAAFAVHILVRPAMLPLFVVPFIFAFLTYDRKARIKLLKILIGSAAGFIIIMMPWWIRNYIVLHKIVLTCTGSGNPLLAGTYPYMESLFSDAGKDIMKSSSTQAAYAKERIIKGFSIQPLLYLKWYTVGKIQIMFEQPWLYVQFPQHRLYQNIFHNLFVWGGLIGIIINSIISKIHRFIYLYGIMFLGLYLVFIPVDRYVYQHMFFLMLATAFLMCYVVEKGLKFYCKKI